MKILELIGYWFLINSGSWFGLSKSESIWLIPAFCIGLICMFIGVIALEEAKKEGA